MTVYTKLFVIFCLLPTVPAPNSLTCLTCHNLLKDRSQCTQHHHCAETCFVEVHHLNGENWYKFGCGHQDACRHLHNHDKDYGPITCKECCSSTGCQMSACATTTTAAPTTMTAAPTTNAPIQTTATSPSSGSVVNTTSICVDHDDATFTCADMTYFGYCNPNAGAGYALAQKRCQKTCGFCT